ncbi:MAG: transcription-repair coupling factor [Candidatus Aureabacteria bacterium]|nr:transcription-repair coupling factor [Candidatus Auribacterota bacterium]
MRSRNMLFAGAGIPASFLELIAHLGRGTSLNISGVFGASLAYLSILVRERTARPIVLITKGPKEVEEIAADMETFGGGDICCFPAWETLPEENVEPHPDIIGERFFLMEKLARDRAAGRRGAGRAETPVIVVASLRSLAQRLALLDDYASEILKLAPGQRLPREHLLRYLEAGGYHRVEMVESKGEYSVRGGIVDLFPPAADFPIRIEFFGDEVGTIRQFHAQTQRTISELAGSAITPFSELMLLRRYRERLGTLFDYLPDDAIIIFHEPAASLRLMEDAEPGGEYSLSPAEISRLIGARQTVYCSLLPESSPARPDAQGLELAFQSLEPYRALALGGELGAEWGTRIFGSLAEWVKQGMAIFIFCNNDAERERLRDLLREREIQLPPGSDMFVGQLSSGFIFPEGRILVLTDAEIFARYRVHRPRRRFKGTVPLKEFTQLKPGDYVVHVSHGIGIYRGIKKLVKDGAEKEFICIEYQEKSKLYAPLEQAGLVERYIGFGKTPPNLDRLGGGRWQGVRVAAQRAIFDYAAEILQLQAARQSREGRAFPPDTAWQKEFENAFIYEETPDQASAIEDVKRDMERSHPMDRLVCGDVGYGKTEVAIRAAFKAVMDGKQVAILVPTTVLAQQHLSTFTDRFADYPVKIEMLSRFRTEKEQQCVIDGLTRGTVDVVIGTHRLIQPDVAFKDLGLVIIDEEQRFGVQHKEKFKKLRLMVDVLTMTATPIPRTLYMSLAGIRDMSTIATPPEDRLSIETAVCEHDEELIRNAIRRELGREGQVYVVHNYVETIERMRETIEKLVPEAVLAVGHGQMADDELEEVMRRFVEGKIDILVCTTIIESGLDIPNVNTIIIDHADRFGLADLYQLRGRVGRYRRRAYAYLLYSKGMGLLDDARRRLKALMDHTSLGSGFKIALRDLEIRGAGNILGHEQHGHIAAIGFDLYCKLLKRSVDTLRGKEVAGIEDIEVNLSFAAGLPAGYIPAEDQRIDLYKKMGEIQSERDIEWIAGELKDRFGPLPKEAVLLLEMCRLKLNAKARGIRSISLQDDRIVAVKHGEELRPGGRYPRLTKKTPLDALREIREKIAQL